MRDGTLENCTLDSVIAELQRLRGFLPGDTAVLLQTSSEHEDYRRQRVSTRIVAIAHCTFPRYPKSNGVYLLSYPYPTET